MKRLRVAVPAAVVNASPTSGHGRMWSSVLRELAPLVDLQVDGGRRTQVWLVDGHGPQVSTRAPVVAQVHEASWDEPATRASVSGPFLDELRDRTLPWLARAASVVVPSAWSAAQVAALGGRPVVAPHGVDADVFRPGPDRTGEVLFVGTVQPRKNLPALKAALVELDRPLTLSLVVGAAADRGDSHALLAEALEPCGSLVVQRLSAETDRELAALMARCAVFCLPSDAEGFGLPVLEAMACAAPVVVTPGGALPEVVGSAAVVVPREVLSEGLSRALADDGTLRHQARARAETMPWSRTAALWLGALTDAAG